MKVTLTEDFNYSLNGSEVITAKAGDTLEGDAAKWAMNQNKAKRADETKKEPPQNKAKKQKQTK